VRVVIADDSVLLRAGLERLLVDAGWQVAASVGDAPALMAAVREHQPDVAIVDVRMPPGFSDEGLRAAVELRRLAPRLGVLVLSQYVEEPAAQELLAMGARGVGYLLKDRVADVSEFIDAVDRVARGGTALDPEVIAQVMARRRRDDPLAPLTPRERDVLALMAEGRSNSAIAARLAVGEGAVEKHVSHIFSKLALEPDDSDHRRVLAVLAFLIVPAASLNVRTPRAEALVAERSVREGLTLLERAGIGAGPLAPIEVEAPAGYARSAAARLREVPGVRAVLAPSGSDWSRNGIALLTVIPTSDTNSPEGRDTLASVRDAAGRLPGVHVGGSSAQSVDFVSAIYGSFPAMLALIVLVTFLFLARAFRSLLLPLKAILLNLVSVAASLGAVQLVWQRGWGSELLWGVPATGSVPEFVPLMVFAFLFGISMDYEVFILSRMREEYDRSGVTARAVTEGMRRTGRLVTLAGLVLIAAFVSLATNASTVVNIFASALAFGILIDATIVRAVLVPALVALMGRWNWWLPTWAGRLFRLSPDGVTAEPVRATE